MVLGTEHGVVTTQVLRAMGVTVARQRTLVARGELVAIGRNLYRSPIGPHGDGRWWQDAAAALARRPDGALSGAAAAAAYGLDGFAVGEPITTSVSAQCSGRGPGVRRRARLEPPASVHGLTVTGINETLIDLGDRLAPRAGCGAARTLLPAADRVELALEDALRRELTSLDELELVLSAAPRSRPGRATWRTVLRRRPPGARPTGSYLETRCVQVLRDGGLPAFDRQVEIRDGQGLIGFVDLFHGGVVIELVGAEWHLDRFHPDHHRYGRLAALGLAVLPFTFTHVEHEGTHVVRTVRSALDATNAEAPRSCSCCRSAR